MSAVASSLGQPVDRVDGPLKVTGGARFAAEFDPAGVAHAVMVQSTVPNARSVRIAVDEAEAMPGVLAVLTPANAPRLPKRGGSAVDPPEGRVLSLLQDDEVHYHGQPIAVVVAERLEQAMAAAARLRVAYQTRAATLSFSDARPQAYEAEQLEQAREDMAWGDVDAGLREAEVTLEAVYSTPMEHHNPMEPHATVAHWEGGHLTLHDSTQQITGVQETVAEILGMTKDQVRVICPYVGGGFGCKGSVWSHVVLAALAAKRVGRPVKLVLVRPQMFGPVGGRPCTEQHLVLGARRDGRLTALRHEVISHTSVLEDYVEPATEPSRALYACGNGATGQRLVALNVGVPTFQRAPGEATGTFALECAMDELAQQLVMDPLELRLRNHAEVEPSSGRPWSSKRLRACYQIAAERFGWSRRHPQPRAMCDGPWLVGWGMATATYPGHRERAVALARAQCDGTVLVQSGTQDLGTGTYTVMTQVAAQTLGLPLRCVRFELGDSRLPQAPISGGSMTVASVGPAVESACRGLRDKLIALATADTASPLHGLKPADVVMDDGWLCARAQRGRREPLAVLMTRHGRSVEARGEARPRKKGDGVAVRSFGALFAEVRVHETLGTLRVPRIVGVYSVGRLLNPKTAYSQLRGGVVWGMGMALFEESLLDQRYGGFANANLAEYHVAVNADVGDIDVSVVEEDDRAFNALGARGIGEIGITGVAAVLANAVHHATGRRIRELPITLDKLL